MGSAAILGILSAILSWVATFGGRPFWGLALALLGGALGAVGLITAASPRVRGGIVSVAAIALSVLGAIVAVLGLIGLLF